MIAVAEKIKLADSQKKHQLRTAQLLALALLITVAIIYVLAHLFLNRYPWLHYVAAFSQAAMIGALADWFAVVALFRHPLGIKLPHTAIIPANKNRIADNLGDFIQERFLTTEKVLDGIRQFMPARRLARWLSRTDNASQLTKRIFRVLAQVGPMINEDKAKTFFKSTLTKRLQKIDGAKITARILSLFKQKGHHQVLLDGLLAELNVFLKRDDVREDLVQTIAKHIEFLPSTLNLDERFGRIILQRLYDAFQSLLDAIRADQQHVLRQHFNGAVTSFMYRLKEDAQLRVRIFQIQKEIIADPEFEKLLDSLWDKMHMKLVSSVNDIESALTQQVIEVVVYFGKSITHNRVMQMWLDKQIIRLLIPLIEKYRKIIGKFIAAQVRTWNDAFMVEQIELNIGRDLQFIRVNGTLVGGLVGLLIYTFTQWLP